MHSKLIKRKYVKSGQFTTGQGKCAICGKLIRPGAGRVMEFGANGRICADDPACFTEWTRQHSTTKRETLDVSAL